MEFEKKVLEINIKLKEQLSDKKNIVIWGAGIHTEKFICMTCILEFWDKITIIDRTPKGIIGNKVVKGINEIQWELVDAVIISSLTYQKEIENELVENESFRGKIVQIYDDKDMSQFFELQKEYDFLTLEMVESWEEASKKSRSGYADKEILQFDYEEFIERKNRSEENRKYEKRHYYDVLFYILKTIVQMKKDEISILDFGGGFGTVFIDLKYYLKNLDIKLKWIIIEQEKIVEWCSKEYYDNGIIYEKSLEDIDKEEKIDFALFGSSIQYLEAYQDIIAAVKALNPRRIALLKTPVADKTFVNIQHVNNKGNYNHYVANYACRVVAEDELVSLFSDGYRLEDSAEDLFNSANNSLDCHIVKWKDFFFEKIV